jgi:hypothetical protein
MAQIKWARVTQKSQVHEHMLLLLLLAAAAAAPSLLPLFFRTLANWSKLSVKNHKRN